MEKEITVEDIHDVNREEMEFESIANMCSWGEFN